MFACFQSGDCIGFVELIACENEYNVNFWRIEDLCWICCCKRDVELGGTVLSILVRQYLASYNCMPRIEFRYGVEIP